MIGGSTLWQGHAAFVCCTIHAWHNVDILDKSDTSLPCFHPFFWYSYYFFGYHVFSEIARM